MRAILHASLFTQGNLQDLALLECFALARDGRHVLLHRRDLALHVEHWISTQSENLQQTLRNILDDSTRRDADMSGRAHTITIIAGDTSEWSQARLCIQDAERLLREPLHILLENALNDLAFLRRLAPTTYRQDLDQALARGWAVAENAGGIDGIAPIIDGLQKLTDTSQGRFQRLRYWVMFDRDSDEADRSQPAQKTVDLARRLGEKPSDDPWSVNFYCLARRAIENYLPTQALRRWAKGHYETATCEALERLRAANHNAACQYNMKAGLLGDNKKLKKALNDRRDALREDLDMLAREVREEHCDKLFHGMKDEDRAALAYGFYEYIASCYNNDKHADFERELQEEYGRGGHAMTREEILESLLQRL